MSPTIGFTSLLLPLADATSHLGIYAIVLAIGFLVGVYGHVVRSRTLIITGIIVIAAVSFYFVASGELQTGHAPPSR
jgi:hypothetical protein